MDISQLTSHLVSLTIAYLLALPIGWDREVKDRSAGLRTFPLVAIATCGFVIATEHLFDGAPDARAKLIEGLITGIGFIGGGAILKEGGSVRGTATAASLWVTGAIGAAVGVESYDVAIALCVYTFITLRLLATVKEKVHEKEGATHLEE